jgi:hypothetical protein
MSIQQPHINRILLTSYEGKMSSPGATYYLNDSWSIARMLEAI